MFDLEQAITDWRKQMLAAGIQAPVPLEELEIHLREEIERQVKLGLSEAEALEVGVVKLGETHGVQSEFKKVEGHKIWHSLLLIGGWLAAGFTLLAGTVGFDLNWNFFSFHPQWNAAVLAAVCMMLVATSGIWLLAKTSFDRAARIGSLLVCLFLAGIGTYNFFRVETGILGGEREVPA